MYVREEGSRQSPPLSLYPYQQLGSLEVSRRSSSETSTKGDQLEAAPPSFKLTLVKSQRPQMSVAETGAKESPSGFRGGWSSENKLQ